MSEGALISFGREICGDLDGGLRREWLVTNGLGGYASSTLVGINTRRYHGLLVASLAPPVERTVLVGGFVEWASADGRRYPLSTHQYGDGTVDPSGYRYLQSFVLDGMLPVWTFALDGALLERRVWMEDGANTSYVNYKLVRSFGPVDLEVTPLVTYRDFHTLSSGRGWRPAIEPQPQAAVVRPFQGAQPLRLAADRGRFVEGGGWYWNFLHREETARGLEDRSDLYAAGMFTASLAPGESLTLVLTTEADADTDGAEALARRRGRQTRLLARARARQAPPAVQQLVLAADQFIVRRRSNGLPDGKTVIAGYHWFNDWGRDTMIALPGLALSTGRAEDAAGILRAFAAFVVDGLLPNNFPDRAGADPGYNTADASLWFVLAVRAYGEATGDQRLAGELLPVLQGIIDSHVRGTRFGIGVDPRDGLLRAGEPGWQLTWMDAKVGEWVVTPRIGKPVEINALWYNALRALASDLQTRGDGAAHAYDALADRARVSFRSRFWRPDLKYLADVVDGPSGDDVTLRPNQIFAVSLPFPLLERDEARSVVEVVGRHLLTTYGLRSLSPTDPAYRGTYGGDQTHRDAAYHQGTVWTWLIGPYAEAHFRVYRDTGAALGLLLLFQHHLRDAGLGTISELADGDPPHLPKGCIAQAWGVAEILRVWRMLTSAPPGRSTRRRSGARVTESPSARL